MRTMKMLIVTVALSVFTLISLSAQPLEEQQNVVETQVVVQETLEDSAEGILYMREEEKLARDVYLTLYDYWGFRTFIQIAQSEQKHMDSVGALIVGQGLEDPIVDAQVGEFKNTTLAALYTTLVQQGLQSPTDAYRVGAIIEDLDIYDLENFLSLTDDAAEKAVYSNLLRGSENHMRSFLKQLSRYGQSYEAQYITSERLALIVQR